MEPGGTYAFTVEIYPPNENYRVESATVTVDAQTVTADFQQGNAPSTAESVLPNAVAAGSLNLPAILRVAGALALRVGASVLIVVNIKVVIVVGGTTVGAYVVTKIWNAIVRGKVHGDVACDTDSVLLDTGEHSGFLGLYKWKNSCMVRYTAGSSSSSMNTDKQGFYLFKRVPCGYDVYVQGLTASNRHTHNGVRQVVSYTPSRRYFAGRMGTRILRVLHWKPSTIAAPTIMMPPAP